jgi:hypothetical protein
VRGYQPGTVKVCFGQQLVAQLAVIEYALGDIHKPMGVFENQLTQALQDDLKPNLPSIKEIERELGRGDDE